MKNKLLVLIILLCTSGCYTAPATEKRAARVIHEAAFGARNFDPCANPNLTFPLCWPGESWSTDMCIEPRCSGGHVTMLYLSRGQLTKLPPEIGELQFLEELDLSGNQLTSLPPEIGQLQTLVDLDLSGNQLDNLPLEIGQLHSLRFLDLSDNQLTRLPPEIGQLRSLERLDLSGNQLTRLPLEIGLLHNLKDLDLSDNQLVSLPPEIGQLRSLVNLELSDNQLDRLPQEIGNLRDLQFLHMDDNPMNGPMPDYLADLSFLESFDISGTALCVPDHERLQAWYAGLKGINYSWTIACSLAEEERAALLTLYEIVGQARNWDINAHPCAWSQVTCDWSGHVVWLNLGNTQLTELPSEIGSFSRLRILWLDFNQLTSLPPEIGQLKRLQELWLHSNRLTELPPEIGQLTELKILDVSFNPLSGPLPLFLTNLPQLSLAFEYTDLCIPDDKIYWDWLEKKQPSNYGSPGTGIVVPGVTPQQQNAQDRFAWMREHLACGK